jgi:hypothetical protein
MKSKIIILFLGLLLAVSCVFYVPVKEGGYPPQEEQYYDEPYPSQVDTSYIYDYLTPYGMWLYQSPYGYVWIPDRVNYGWRPYTNGQWIWSDYGWTWVSSYRWGWIPFHYGRWGWDRQLGWFWVPDTIWGPAWVSWRRGDIYIGWAPLPPEARFIFGVGINSLPYTLSNSYWVFVEYPYFLDARLYRYVLPMERNITIINYTMVQTDIVVRNNRIINRGIDIEYVSRAAKRRIYKHELSPLTRPGPSRLEGNRIEMYNPDLERNETAEPKKVVKRDEVLDRITRTNLRSPTGRTQDRRDEGLENTQEEEMKTLEESQKKELNEINKKMEQEKNEAKSSEAKKKIEEEYRERITKIKKSHETEKTQIKKRHEKETEEAKKKKVKKKEIK